MNKLAKALKAISHIIRKPYLLNYILEDENLKKEEFLKKFPDQKELKQIPFTHFLNNQPNVTVAPYAYLGGSSLPTDLALLQLLCKENKVEDYLEIGTWRGESVANVAPFVKNCHSLNLPDETMKTMGLDEDYINMHRYFSMDLKNVTHLFGHSQTYDFEKLDKKFDLIFIDGDHHTVAVENDTKRVQSLLKSDQSIIVWHDAQIDPETPRYEVLMGIYSGMPKEKHKHIYLVSNSLCAVYYPFEVKHAIFKENRRPEHFFSVELKVKKNYSEKKILLQLLELTPINGRLEIYSFDENIQKLINDIADKNNDDYTVVLTKENKKKFIEIAVQYPMEYLICHMSFYNAEKEQIFLCYDSFATILISKEYKANDFLQELMEDGFCIVSNEW